MPIFIKNDKYLLYVHVPKTGGTSVETLFHRSGFGGAYIDYGAPGSTLNHLRFCSPQHMHSEILQDLFVMDRFYGIFMTVRNPYDRFRSEYCMANPINCDLSAFAVEAWAERVFFEYATNKYLLDNHIRPQHEFRIPGATVYKIEDGFTNIAENLAKQYGIRLISSEIRELARSKHSGIVSSDVTLNSAVKEMINTQYREDFKQFGYIMDTSA